MKNDPSCLSCEASLGILSAGGNFCGNIIADYRLNFKKKGYICQPFLNNNLIKVNK